MSVLIDFKDLKDEITLVNRFNIIKLIFGKKISNNGFNGVIEEKELIKIIKNIKNLNLKIKEQSYISEIFYKKNERIIKTNDVLVYNIITSKVYFIQNNLIAINEKISSDEYTIPCYIDYDNKEILEILDLIIGSYLIVRIKKNIKLDINSIEIIINKPNEPEIIIDLIDKIISI